MTETDLPKIEHWLTANRPILDELLGPWRARGFAWETTAAFIAWAIEQRFGVPRGGNNRLDIYEVHLEETGQRFHPTINLVLGEPFVTGDEFWMTDRIFYQDVELRSFEWWIARMGEFGSNKIVGSLLPWCPDRAERSQSGTGDEFWNDILEAARRLTYPVGRPMVHGLWTLDYQDGEPPRIVPDMNAIQALEATFPDILARMS